jgi:KUP system potassium uptake protein
LPKIVEGGWVPLAIGVVVFTLLHTWTTGRRRLAQRLAAESMPVDAYLRETRGAKTRAIDGTAVFLTAHPGGVPYVAQHPWLRAHIAYDTVVLLTVVNAAVP